MKANMIQLDGMMTCQENGAVLSYKIKKGDQVLAEENGLTSLPGKVFDISIMSTIAQGTYTVILTGSNGILRVGWVGIQIVCSDGSEVKVNHEKTPAVVLNFEGITQVEIIITVS
jgi:hypothetical protein